MTSRAARSAAASSCWYCSRSASERPTSAESRLCSKIAGGWPRWAASTTRSGTAQATMLSISQTGCDRSALATSPRCRSLSDGQVPRTRCRRKSTPAATNSSASLSSYTLPPVGTGLVQVSMPMLEPSVILDDHLAWAHCAQPPAHRCRDVRPVSSCTQRPDDHLCHAGRLPRPLPGTQHEGAVELDDRPSWLQPPLP